MEASKNYSDRTYKVGKALLFCLLCAIILAGVSGFTKGLAPVYATAIACLLTFFLTIAFTGFSALRLKGIGVMPTSKSGRLILLGVGVGIMLSTFQVMILLIAGHTSLVLSTETTLFSITINLLLYVFVAVREEVAFRGYPLVTLKNAVGPLLAQIIVAAIFILEHFIGGMNWWQAILGPGIGAILFGLAALRSKGIAFPAGIHFAWNVGQWLLGLKDNSGIFRMMIDKGYENQSEIVGWVGYVIVMGAAILVILNSSFQKPASLI